MIKEENANMTVRTGFVITSRLLEDDRSAHDDETKREEH